MQLARSDYRNKLLGCWMGKNIGGTLGMPFEWRRQLNDVTFYTQQLAGEPLPNDDLDIQLLWLVALEERGIALDAHTLADYWCLYVTPHWAEYGTAKINMRSGLTPPHSGTMHNAYRHSCGAFIRSEIWACIAPGSPQIAARFAVEDGILDHGDGEGTWGEIFCAAVESAAFVCDDLRALIEIGLSYISPDCGVAGAVRCAVAAFDAGKSWQAARDDILAGFRGSSHMNQPRHTSPEDQAKGFHEGVQGYDAPSNVAITVLGLLYGGDDFEKMICTTVNCGEDTDCTGATAGAIFGIMHGIDAIPAKWIEPIGRKIKTACLNLGELGWLGRQLPQTIDEMADRTERLAGRVHLANPRYTMAVSGSSPTDLSDLNVEALRSDDGGAAIAEAMTNVVHRFEFFNVLLDYGKEGPVIRNGEPKTLRFMIRNTYKIQANLSLHWYLPEGWTVAPGPDAYVMSLMSHLGAPASLEFTLAAESVVRAINRAVLEITIEGRPTVMLIPVTLQNGNAMPVAE